MAAVALKYGLVRVTVRVRVGVGGQTRVRVRPHRSTGLGFS